jgi:hypothetical protein
MFSSPASLEISLIFWNTRFFTAFTITGHFPLVTRLNPVHILPSTSGSSGLYTDLPTSRTTKASWFDSDMYNRFICSANYSLWRWDPTGVLFNGYRRLFPWEQNSQFVEQAARTLVPTLIGGAVPPFPYTSSGYSLGYVWYDDLTALLIWNWYFSHLSCLTNGPFLCTRAVLQACISVMPQPAVVLC